MRDSETVGGVRRRVGRERGLEEGELTVVFAGRRLDDALTLSDYNVRSESCLHIQARPAPARAGASVPARACARAGACVRMPLRG